MRLKACFLFLFIVIASVRASSIEESILSSAPGVISVSSARVIVNDLWKQSFSIIKDLTPVQRLTSGFERLLTSLKNDQHRSTAEQAYLMWLSGRTHGFDETNKSRDDALAQNKVRDDIASSVARRLLVDMHGSTEACIDFMLKGEKGYEASSPLIRQQDEALLGSVASYMGVWAFDVGKHKTLGELIEYHLPSSQRNLVMRVAHAKAFVQLKQDAEQAQADLSKVQGELIPLQIKLLDARQEMQKLLQEKAHAASALGSRSRDYDQANSISPTSESLQTLESKKIELAAEISTLQRQIADAEKTKEERKKLIQDLDQLKSEFSRSKLEKQKVSDQLIQSQRAIQSLEDRKKNLETQFLSLQKQVQDERKAEAKAHQDLTQLRADRQELEQEKKKSSDALNQSRKAIQLLEDRKKTLEVELSSLQKQMKDEVQTKAEHSKKVQELEGQAQLGELEKKLKEIQQQITDAEYKRNKALEKQLAVEEFLASTENLGNSGIASLLRTAANKKNGENAVRQLSISFEAAYDYRRQQYEFFTGELRNKKNEMSGFLADVKKKEELSVSLASDIEKYRAQIEEKKETICEQKEKISEYDFKIKSIGREINSLTSEHDRLTRQLSTLQQQLQGAEEAKKAHEKLIQDRDQLTKQLSTLQQQLQGAGEAKKEHEKLIQDLDQLRANHSRLDVEVQKLQKEAQQLEAQKASAKSAIAINGSDVLGQVAQIRTSPKYIRAVLALGITSDHHLLHDLWVYLPELMACIDMPQPHQVHSLWKSEGQKYFGSFDGSKIKSELSLAAGGAKPKSLDDLLARYTSIAGLVTAKEQVLSLEEIIHRRMFAVPAIADRTGTDAFLERVLGDRYIKSGLVPHLGHNQSISPVQSADIANIIQFLEKFKDSRDKNSQLFYNQPILDEFEKAKTQSPSDWPPYVKGMLNCMQNERLYPGYLFAYHTLPADMAFANQVIALTKSLLTAQAPGAHAQRGCDKLFGDAKSVDEILTMYQFDTQRMKDVHNYDSRTPKDKNGTHLTNQPVKVAQVLLSVNPFLWGNPSTYTSCTYAMWNNDKSVRPPEWKIVLQSFFNEIGASEFILDKLAPVFEEYKKVMPSSLLWQIMMTPDVGYKVMYLCGVLGKGLENSIDQCRPTLLSQVRKNPSSLSEQDLIDMQARISPIPEYTEGENYYVKQVRKEEVDSKKLSKVNGLIGTVVVAGLEKSGLIAASKK